MNKSISAHVAAGVLAIGLLAGSQAALAVTSSCVFGDYIECDLYESGGTTIIALDRGVVTGTVGIFETGDPTDFRDVLSFYLDNSTYFLQFYFGALPTGPYSGSVERTGLLTTYDVGNIYRIHHDASEVGVPEPGTLALLGLGLAGLGLSRRRKAN